jgi:hypothetical protein
MEQETSGLVQNEDTLIFSSVMRNLVIEDCYLAHGGAN